ncbi:MAG: hypothetical protein LBT42_08465 [Tannerella sp.]|jgi:YVTN family beta-propeller protein|nr:hypothetical protein [Tannerella sp.]
MNKKVFIYSLCATMVLPFISSCSDEDDPVEDPVVASEYVYVLNSGNMGSNDASLSMYNLQDGTVTKGVFEARNGRRLGDTGQDIIAYGSKIYISMTGESTIEVTDLDAKSIEQIQTDGQPRYLASYNGKVYVTLMNGYVARLDTASLTVETKIRVGRNPERLTVANRKLYVANSGGQDWSTGNYDNTVSVIDMTSFTETKKIEVALNPTEVESDDAGNVYVISKGNYNNVLNTLQKIDVSTDGVTVLNNINGTIFTSSGDIIYSVHSQWGAPQIYYYSLETSTGRVLSDNFIGSTNISDPYQINYDRNFEHLFITASDYQNEGDVYIFDKSCLFVNKFEAGLNPMKAVWVQKYSVDQ